MSIKRNTLANFAGQGYTTLIGVFIIPFYLKYLGAEAYGLVGFFGVLNSWLNLLDMGFSPALSREVSATRGGAQDFSELRKLLRSLEIVFLCMSILIALTIFLGKNFLAEHWLKVSTLEHADVACCVILMGLMIGLRWFVSLYRSGIRGMEAQVWLNGTNVIISSIRFIGAYILLRFVSQSVVGFFKFQLAISFLELVVIGCKFYSLLPGKSVAFLFLWGPIRRVLPFAGGIAYTSGIWIVVTQLDKLILSHYLPLKEYGYYALAAMVANATQSMAGPISQALLPRMTYLLAQGKNQEMILLYRKASQVLAAIVFPLVLVISTFSMELLYFWTGNEVAANWAGPVLSWYVLGNGVLAVSAYQYYLQFAHGKVKLHVVYNTVSVIVTIPVIFYATANWGGIGAAIAWFGLRVFSFVVYVPIVHSLFVPGIHLKWLFCDILPFVVFPVMCLAVIKTVVPQIGSLPRGLGFVTLLFIGFCVLTLNCFLSQECRVQLRSLISKSWKSVK